MIMIFFGILGLSFPYPLSSFYMRSASHSQQHPSAGDRVLIGLKGALEKKVFFRHPWDETAQSSEDSLYQTVPGGLSQSGFEQGLVGKR
jgi:hypothetical protein